ncbi:PBP1A family penicillin-binding protein [Herbivorax sp. ANBcel31]|uniref:transglycosylase domain-containing protein n=1 Tax=Herbivorax sp. ANBcel31 TaxID=3069754 RepID=UPI0027B38BE5|nr:PBP1A family penicillin-binding protein [Herbivorax sp. ANBcel31]MDQ2086937.1 PBP1A family penicillin-binding protein [Herbivorax sp. ANBcel31]
MKSKNTSNRKRKSNKKKIVKFAFRFSFLVFKMLLLICVTISFSLAGVAGGVGFAYIQSAEKLTPDQLTLDGFTSHVYDTNGEIIVPLQGSKNREMVDLRDIPDDLKNAFIAIEDRRFFEHPGIDYRRIASAVTSGGSHGASTITQQVIKNITGNDERSVERKVQEWWIAMHLEQNLSKDQILELYLNLVYLAQNCYGVQSASRTYFDKDVSELTLAESATLAGITRSPAYYDPFTTSGRENNKERQELILSVMHELEYITEDEYKQAKNEELQYADSNRRSADVITNQSYFVDQVITDVMNDLMEEGHSRESAYRTIYNGGVEIHTTVDPTIQQAMDEVFLSEEHFTNVNTTTSMPPQAAMTIIDPTNGHIKALYGGAGEKIGSPLNRASSSQVKRQPGSTFKSPVVYGPAINERKITAATAIDNIPVYLNPSDETERYPRNYSWNYTGLSTARYALARSFNVSAARVWDEYLEPEIALDYLKKAGIDRTDETYLSIALGGPRDGINPLQLAASYVPFANKGLYFEPVTYTKVLDINGDVLLENKPESTIVYDETTAFIMTDMMKDVMTYGTGGAARFSNEMPLAGKTGTTSKNYDKWFVGYSPYYVGATWYGYDQNTSIESSEQGRANAIWHDVMKNVHENLEVKQFEEPPGIVRETICTKSGKLVSELCSQDPSGSTVKTEIFIAGTEPRDECNVHVKVNVCEEHIDEDGRPYLASHYCPPSSTTERVFVRRPVPVNPSDFAEVEDSIYEVPTDYCPEHDDPFALFRRNNDNDEDEDDNDDDNGDNRSRQNGFSNNQEDRNDRDNADNDENDNHSDN